MDPMKKPYVKPELKLHGAVEAVTGYTADYDLFKGGFLGRGKVDKKDNHGPSHNFS